jgi:hypothetical protein
MRSVCIAASIAGEDDILYTLPIQGTITQLRCAYKNADQVMLPVRRPRRLSNQLSAIF